MGAQDRARRLSVRAGRYFLRGRAPDVLLEGTVDAPPGDTLIIDESRFERTAYARLVRKGGGAATAVASVEAEARMRSSLLGETGVCPGVDLITTLPSPNTSHSSLSMRIVLLVFKSL